MLTGIVLAYALLADGSHEGSPAGASEPAAVEIRGAIGADGTVAGPAAAWRATRHGLGSYELHFAGDVRLDVTSWDAAAAVTLTPTATASWAVELVADGAPVDAAFAFRAVPAEP